MMGLDFLPIFGQIDFLYKLHIDALDAWHGSLLTQPERLIEATKGAHCEV